MNFVTISRCVFHLGRYASFQACLSKFKIEYKLFLSEGSIIMNSFIDKQYMPTEKACTQVW